MNQRQLHEIKIELTLKAPWLVHGNDPGRFGLDAVLLRNAENHPIIPGTLLVGRIRQSWQEMKAASLDVPDANTWFGAAADNTTHRARIIVNDLATKPTINLPLQTRVKIDHTTGAAAQGMLMVVEQQHLPGEHVTFNGTWHVYATADEAAMLRAALPGGIHWHSQLGALRSVGFGEIVSCKVGITGVKTSALPSPKTTSTLGLSLTLDRPACFDTESLRGNVFISGTTLKGATIKAAVARQLQDIYRKDMSALASDLALARHFDQIVFRHGYYSEHPDRRPAAIPLSIVASANAPHDLYDVAELKTPCLINGMAPTFIHDWKGATFNQIEKLTQAGHQSRYLRVRTAIDTTTGAADDGQLFAYDCVYSKDKSWQAEISLDQVPKEQHHQILSELATLLGNGLGPIGKTDARATVRFKAAQTVWRSAQPINVQEGQSIRLLLNSDALLFPSSQFSNSPEPLHTLYQQAFDSLSGGALNLSHYYASQKLQGGKYLWNRFIKREQTDYLPYILTEAGSVFVLTVAPGKSAEASDTLTAWQSSGLPMSADVAKEHGDNWESNPFIPENGYGEVIINPEHTIKPYPQSQANQIMEAQ